MTNTQKTIVITVDRMVPVNYFGWSRKGLFLMRVLQLSGWKEASKLELVELTSETEESSEMLKYCQETVSSNDSLASDDPDEDTSSSSSPKLNSSRQYLLRNESMSEVSLCP